MPSSCGSDSASSSYSPSSNMSSCAFPAASSTSSTCGGLEGGNNTLPLWSTDAGIRRGDPADISTAETGTMETCTDGEDPAPANGLVTVALASGLVTVAEVAIDVVEGAGAATTGIGFVIDAGLATSTLEVIIGGRLGSSPLRLATTGGAAMSGIGFVTEAGAAMSGMGLVTGAGLATSGMGLENDSLLGAGESVRFSLRAVRESPTREGGGVA